MRRIPWFTGRRAALVVVCLAVVLVGATVFGGSGLKRESGAAVTPYTVELVETITGPNGQSAVASIGTIAMRSDGSVVHRLGTPEKGSRLLLFSSGVRVYTNDVTRRMSSTPVDFIAQINRDPSANCAKKAGAGGVETFGGLEWVAGHRAAKFVESSTGFVFATALVCPGVQLCTCRRSP